MRATRILLAAGWLAAAQPAAAEHLVLNDGQRVETRGPWRVEGPLVVFTRAGGSFSSVRLSSVDLAASRAASAPPASAPPPAPAESREAPAPARKPVLVLTNKDVPRAAGARGAAARLAEPEEARRLARRLGEQLVVEAWVEIELDGGEGVAIVGRLKNRSRETVRPPAVAIDLRDRDGEVIATTYARPDVTLLAAGARTSFRGEFRGVGKDRGRPSFRIGSAREADAADPGAGR